MTEERKLVTVLFADIVGSTAATASSEPEIVRSTLARAFAEMRQILEGHDGTVEKFIGDAVMCVFGAPQTHDDDADRAVRAAFAIRTRIAEIASSLHFPLQLRIGVNTGRVVAGTAGADTLVTGTPVITASRLQSAAEPGEILVGPDTRRLTDGSVAYGPARSIDAKGLGALEAHPVLDLITAVPEVRRGMPGLRAPLIGRDSELLLLREAWRRTREMGMPALITIYGEPGVGKSRLVSELIDLIGPEHARSGRCLSYGTGITYWPIQEIVRTDAGIAGGDPSDLAIAKVRAATLGALGERDDDAASVVERLLVLAGLVSTSTGLRGISAGELTAELRWAARRYFERRAQRSPLVLVFDDIQWADQALLDLIEHLTERVRAPVLVICLARPELRERSQGWASGLTNASAIRLDPLDASETRRLIAALLEVEELADDLRSELVRHADGNPLYVEELIRMMLETGQVERRGDRFVAAGSAGSLSIPATLEALLAARLDQLDPDSKHAVRCASVVGQVFYPNALISLGATSDRLDSSLRRAARRDLVFELDERGPDGRPAWAFKHLLIRDAAYESLPKAERWRLHDAVGRWLEARPGAGDVSGVVAYHAERAFWIAREVRAAGSVDLGSRALDLTLAEARRVWHREQSWRPMNEAYTRVRDVAEAIDAPAAVRIEARGRAAVSDRPGPNEATVDAALIEARQLGPSPVLVDLLFRKAWLVSGREGPAGDPMFDEAMSVALKTNDAVVISRAMLETRWPLIWAGRLMDARALLESTHEYILSVQRDRPDQAMDLPLASVLIYLHNDATRVGDAEGAARYEALWNDARPHLPSTAWLRMVAPHVFARNRARLEGDIESWVAHARRREAAAVSLGAGEDRDQLAMALLEAGRCDEALAVLEPSFRSERKDPYFAGEIRQLLARALLCVGQLDRARAEAERAYGEIKDDDPASRSSTSLTLGLVREAMGDLAEAERLLGQAIACTRGFVWHATRARVELARFLMHHGRAGEARPLLEAARDFYNPRFSPVWHARVVALLRECEAVAAS